MICKDKIRRKKTLCSTFFRTAQGLKFLDFLGRSQAARSCLLGAVRGCRDFPKTIQLLPLVLGTYNLNNSVYKLFTPVLLGVLIIHIIIAIRWMFIKILSAMIKHYLAHKAIVPGGYCFDSNMIHKID